MRRKRRAARQIGIEIDPIVVQTWKRIPDPPCELICADAVDWLCANTLENTALIYADPPYLPATRRRARVYRHDYVEHDHVRLLERLKAQNCSVMISGYRSSLYDELLPDWNHTSFQAKTHSGMREEMVWFNFEPANQLHDVDHMGDGFRSREVIRRRRSRLQERISRLSRPEQFGLLEWLQHEVGGQDGPPN